MSTYPNDWSSQMRHLLFAASLVASASALAEPAVQPGQTLESLSQAQTSTTVNGQPGSLKELLQDGKYKLVSPDPISNPASSPQTESTPPSVSTSPSAP